MTNFRPAILSASLGRAWVHDFEGKAQAAAKYGFEGIEIFYEDLEYLGKKLHGTEKLTDEHVLATAKHIREVLDQVGLTVICLQPFLLYEGLLDREEHARLIVKLKLWFKIAKILGTDTIQIPANFLPTEKLTGDLDVIVGDMLEVAELGQREEPPIRFGYESLCWSTHIDTWEKSWEIVQRVDRPNFGLSLDTFNIAGRVWADPTSPTGKTPNADVDLQASIDRMVNQLDVGKIFFIQVVDAEALALPLVKGHPFYNEDFPPRMSWSRNARTFIYEEDRGAYLPVEDIARALIKGLGYKGWVSMELFSRTTSEEGEHVPAEHAERGIESWKKFVQRLGLD